MNARDNGENWVVIGPSHVELGPQVPAMVGNRSLTLMAYIFGMKQATKMRLSLLHSALTATSFKVNKSSGTSLCWLIQTPFPQSNHDGMLNFNRIVSNSRFMYCTDQKQDFPTPYELGR